MRSWKLWQTLKHPPYHHPLMYRTRADTGWLTALWDRVLPFYLYAMLLGTIYVMWRITPHTFGFLFLLILLIPALATLFFLVSPLLFPLGMMVVGALWAANISERLVEQQELGIYDLLCVLPGGRWAANWATACGSVHQGSIFEVGWLILRVLLGVGVALLVMLCGVALGQVRHAETGGDNISWFMLDMVVLLVVYTLQYIQTMALVPLVGLLVPTLTRSRVEARLGAAGLYLAVQLGSFLLVGLLFWGVSLFFGGSLLPGGASGAAGSLTPYLIAFFGLREAVIMRLWVVLLRRLMLTTAEKENLGALLRRTA